MSITGSILFAVGFPLTVVAFFFAVEWWTKDLKSALKMLGFMAIFLTVVVGILAFWLWLGSVIA